MSELRIYVENEADESLANILLASEPVVIENRMTSSGATSMAEFSLVRNRDKPVVVLLSARTQDPNEVEGYRSAIFRNIAHAGSMRFHIALAAPRLLDWLLTDEKLRRAYESSPQDMTVYGDRVSRVAELARSIPFDRSTLEEQSEEFRDLLAFIRKYTSAVPAKPSRAG